MKHSICFAAPLLLISVAAAQTDEWQCRTVDTTSNPLSYVQAMINMSQPLVLILVDFPDGRIQPGNIIPTFDADTALIENIDGTGGMGYVPREDPNDPFRKKIRKYAYEDYWDMIFSAAEYVGNFVHPDYESHDGLVLDPPIYNATSYNLTMYGSVYDYYDEVSGHNLLIQAQPTRSGGDNK